MIRTSSDRRSWFIVRPADIGLEPQLLKDMGYDKVLDTRWFTRSGQTGGAIER